MIFKCSLRTIGLDNSFMVQLPCFIPKQEKKRVSFISLNDLTGFWLVDGLVCEWVTCVLWWLAPYNLVPQILSMSCTPDPNFAVTTMYWPAPMQKLWTGYQGNWWERGSALWHVLEEVGGYHCREHYICAVARGAGARSTFWVTVLVDHTPTPHWA